MQDCGSPMDPDSAPPPPDIPVSRAGDLWLCGEGDQVIAYCAVTPLTRSRWRACWAIARLIL